MRTRPRRGRDVKRGLHLLRRKQRDGNTRSTSFFSPLPLWEKPNPLTPNPSPPKRRRGEQAEERGAWLTVRREDATLQAAAGRLRGPCLPTIPPLLLTRRSCHDANLPVENLLLSLCPGGRVAVSGPVRRAGSGEGRQCSARRRHHDPQGTR